MIHYENLLFNVSSILFLKASPDLKMFSQNVRKMLLLNYISVNNLWFVWLERTLLLKNNHPDVLK